MDKETKMRTDAQVIAFIAKCNGAERTINDLLSFKSELRRHCPAEKKFKYLFSECWYYVFPITKETKVQRGVIVRKYEKDDEDIFLFLGEDGMIYDDDTETVMGSEKEQVERILNDLKDDMEKAGEFD